MSPPGALSGRRSPSALSGLGLLDQLCLKVSEVLYLPLRGESCAVNCSGGNQIVCVPGILPESLAGWPLLRIQAPA